MTTRSSDEIDRILLAHRVELDALRTELLEARKAQETFAQRLGAMDEQISNIKQFTGA